MPQRHATLHEQDSGEEDGARAQTAWARAAGAVFGAGGGWSLGFHGTGEPFSRQQSL